jgi:hypothetical protein
VPILARQINLFCAPHLENAERSETAPNGGYLRIAADQRWLQTVIRFQAGHRAKR